MANATAEAPVRANKAPSKAKATPFPAPVTAAAPAPAAPPIDQTSLAAAKAMQMVSVLMSGILDIDDFSSLDAYADQFTALNAQVDRLAYGDANDQPVQITRLEVTQLQMLFTAITDALEASVSTLPRGTVLLVATLARQAEELLGRIADAMEVGAGTLGPLNALGTYAGVRPQREQLRPAAPNAPDAIPPADPDEAGLLELARLANYEILKLAEALQTLTMHEGTEEHPITFGIAARVRMLAEVVFHAAALHGSTREEIGSPDLTELQRRVKGGL